MRVARAGVLCACLLPALACATLRGAPEDEHGEPMTTVSAISWEGVAAFPTRALEDAILTTEANWRPWIEDKPFRQGTLDEDVARLEAWYARRGYYEAQVSATTEPAGEHRVRVRFTVAEGEPVLLGALSIGLVDADAYDLDPTPLFDDLPLVPGEVFDLGRYRDAKTAILARLAARGHPGAWIEGGAQVRLEHHDAEVAWRVHPGPFVRFGASSVTGAEKIEPRLIEREIRIEPGTPYDPAVLERQQRRLFDLGVFRSVTVEAVPPEVEPPPAPSSGPGVPEAQPAPGPEATAEAGPPPPTEAVWPVVVRVDERKPRSVRLGVGYGSDEGVRVKGEWVHRNFLGGLRTLRLIGRYSQLDRGFEALFQQPHFLLPDLTLSLDARLDQDDTPAYDSEGFSTGWRLERPMFEHVVGRLGQRLELRRVSNVNSDSEVEDQNADQDFRLVYFQLGARRSTLDVPLDPKRGTFLDLSLEPSVKALGSDLDYLRAVADGRWFLPVPLPFERLGLGEIDWEPVIATHLRLGTLEPLGSARNAQVPIFKRFFAGGTNSVRGFRLYELGPLDEGDDPIGGLTVAEGNLELRFPIWRKLGGVAFLDAGQVALDSFTLRRDDFYYSAGGGLRLATPIGPIRVDVGRILNPPSNLPVYQVHFTIGQAF